MTYHTLTNKILAFIETKFFNSRKSLLEEVSKVLNLQPASIYKKIKGESSLSLEEAEILCRHFRMSLDEILALDDDRIYFDFPALYGTVSNENEFLEPIKRDLEMLYRLKPTIYYATKEMPIFYYFLSPRLIAFKFHVFNNLIWQRDGKQQTNFDYNKYLANEEFVTLVNDLLELYSSMDSIEIWNTSVLDNTFNQIKYFLDSGLMDHPYQCLDICNDLELMIDKVSELIKNKNKSGIRKSNQKIGNFVLYNNEISHTNNVIYVNSETHDAVYCTYDSPNFMQSISPILCDYTDKWFHKIIQNSISITDGNLKDQSHFINKLKEKLKKCRNVIEISIQSSED